MNLRTTPSADADVATLAAQLESVWPGRGARFLAAYRNAAENIELFPQMYSLTEDGVPGVEVRNAPLERFELRIVYVVRESEAVIVAVTHGRRAAGLWHDRLTEANPEE